MSAERLARLVLVYLVAALLVGGWVESRIDAASAAGYRHPCAEDEFVRVDGACVHVDRLGDGS